jgi:hypothetical protein
MRFSDYINENYLVVSDGNNDLETLKLKFTKHNIEKIAYNYDAIIIKIENYGATLKDNYGRLLFVDKTTLRSINRKKNERMRAI